MKVLLVSYFYPPSTDTGAHRPASMARHLALLGHEVTVLTTRAYGTGGQDEPGPARVEVGEAPARAEVGEAPASAAAGIEPASSSAGARHVRVARAFDLQLVRARLAGRRTMGSMYDADTYSQTPHPLAKAIVPEPLALAWAPFARRLALRLAYERGFDCVVTTSPPESAHAIGRALSRRGVAWVADLRDAWTFEPIRPPFPTRAQHRLDERLEERWLTGADVVTCVSAPAARDLERRLGIEPLLVPNGFDPETRARAAAESGVALDPTRVSLVYTGRFGSYGRDPGGLAEAMRRLALEEPETAVKLELVIAGPLTAQERRLFATVPRPARVVVAGSLARERAVALQHEADALLLLAHARRSQLANYKLFEYLEAGRPLVALAEGTEAGRIAREAGCEVASAADPEAIIGALRALVEGGAGAPSPEAATRYRYPQVATLMAGALELAVARARH